MRQMMQSYCHMVKSEPSQYSQQYLDEFQQRLESARAGPGQTIQENRFAGTVAVVSMLVYCLSALMRTRYD